MFLIDGHNLIGSGLIPGIHLAQEDDEARLIAWLRARQPKLRQKIVVIFDGGIPGGLSRALSGSGVTAIFAAQRRSNADKVILARVREARPVSRLVVVTNDSVLREAVRGLGAQTMSAGAFIQHIQQPSRRYTATSASPKLEPKLSKQEVDEFLRLFGAEE